MIISSDFFTDSPISLVRFKFNFSVFRYERTSFDLSKTNTFFDNLFLFIALKIEEPIKL